MTVNMKANKFYHALKLFDQNNINYVIIIGENEFDKEQVKLKNLNTTEEKTLRISEISNILDLIKI